MKTYIIILSSLFLLASCGWSNRDRDTPTNTNPVTPNISETKPSDGVPAVDPRTVESAAVTSDSSSGMTIRPR